MSDALVIAYGNPLRGDDGAGWHVARRLEEAGFAAEIVCCQQLTPELAERVSAAAAVVFVDASRRLGAGEIAMRHIEAAAEASTRLSHACTPSSLLALAHLLNGATPRTYEIGIGIADDAPGERLSPAVTLALPRVVEQIRALIAAV